MESKIEFDTSLQYNKGGTTESDEKSTDRQNNNNLVDGSGSDQATALLEDPDRQTTLDEANSLKPIFEKENQTNGKKKGEDDSGADDAPEDD